MQELKLVGVLISSLLLQLCLLPFRIASFIFAIIEGSARVIKKTINNFIKATQDEVIK